MTLNPLVFEVDLFLSHFKGAVSRYFCYSSLYHFFMSSELKHVNEILTKRGNLT